MYNLRFNREHFPITLMYCTSFSQVNRSHRRRKTDTETDSTDRHRQAERRQSQTGRQTQACRQADRMADEDRQTERQLQTGR